MRPLSIYIHVPFCARKCAYCDFYSGPCGSAVQAQDYADALCRHLRQRSADMADYRVQTVYFGGGTPSLLGSELLCRILACLSDCVQIDRDAEITVEANPGELRCRFDAPGNARDALQTLRRGGFNRISMGVQSAQDHELALLGRRHTFLQACHSVEDARAAGFENLSLDLIYALPDQTQEIWLDSLQKVAALSPEHISCYALTLSEHVPLFSAADRLPGEDAQLSMYLAASELLRAHGYAHYEISNFARPGYRSRHNSVYWNGGDYLGFGPGAHSLFCGCRFSIAPDTAAYCAGAFAPQDCMQMTAQDLLEERVMLGLRTSDGVPLAELEHCARDGARLRTLLHRYCGQGLCTLQDDVVRLTPRGYFVSDAMILNILEQLEDF